VPVLPELQPLRGGRDPLARRHPRRRARHLADPAL